MAPKIFILSGPSAAGKSTIARAMAERTRINSYSIREHYNTILVPEFRQLTGNNDPLGRSLHMAVADWMYAQDLAGHAKRFLRDHHLADGGILESFRIKGDLEYFSATLHNVAFIHVYADPSIRLKRKLASNDALFPQSPQEISDLLAIEWNKFHLDESMRYLESRGALMLDTSKEPLNRTLDRIYHHFDM